MMEQDMGQMPAALILAGGKGKRLLPLTEHSPKPLLPVGGRALLLQILENLAEAGVKRCVVTAGYGGEQIKEALGRYRTEKILAGMDLQVLVEERPLGSAGCLPAAADLLGERFFVVCGDAYGKRDYRGMLKRHLEKGAFATLFLTRVSLPVEYGLVRMDEQGRVTSFLEKPTWSQACTDLANGGIYLFEREVLSFIPVDRPSDFGKDVFPILLAQGKELYGFEDGGYWQDIGDKGAYLACNLRASAGKSVYGERCSVKGIVEGSVLLDGVIVEADCRIKGSVIGRNCYVGRGSVIGEGCVLGDGCRLGQGCRLEQGTVLSGGTRLEAGKSIKSGQWTGGLHFEENRLLLPEEGTEDFLIRLGYAFAGAAGGEVLLMHDGEARARRICTALGRGACLAGAAPAMAGEGFYAYCGGLTALGGFSAGALVVRAPAGAEEIAFFDRAGLPANGRLIRRIRDGFAGAVICGRIGRERSFAAQGRALYSRALCTLSGIGGVPPLAVGLEEGMPAGDLTAALLRAQGHTVLPYGKGDVNLYLFPDGRRCTVTAWRPPREESEGLQELTADFWHLCAILLLDRLKGGGRVTALPERAPEALFLLAKAWGSDPIRYPLQSSSPVAEGVREALLIQREPLDGCLSALSFLEVMGRTGKDLSVLLKEAEEECPFGIFERGLDCAPEEKLSLLLSVGASPAGEGVRRTVEGGTVRIRARGGRGLSLMAEAASESDAHRILEEVRRALLQNKRRLHREDLC